MGDSASPCVFCGEEADPTQEACCRFECSVCGEYLIHGDCRIEYLRRMDLHKTSIHGFMCPRGRGKFKADADCKGRIVQTNYLDGMMRKKKKAPPPPAPAPTPRQAQAKTAPGPKPAQPGQAAKPKLPALPQPQPQHAARAAPALTLAQQKELKEQQLRARMGIGAAAPVGGSSSIPGAEFVPSKPKKKKASQGAAAAGANGAAGGAGGSRPGGNSTAAASSAAASTSTSKPWQVAEQEGAQDDPFARMRMPTWDHAPSAAHDDGEEDEDEDEEDAGLEVAPLPQPQRPGQGPGITLEFECGSASVVSSQGEKWVVYKEDAAMHPINATQLAFLHELAGYADAGLVEECLAELRAQHDADSAPAGQQPQQQASSTQPGHALPEPGAMHGQLPSALATPLGAARPLEGAAGALHGGVVPVPVPVQGLGVHVPAAAAAAPAAAPNWLGMGAAAQLRAASLVSSAHPAVQSQPVSLLWLHQVHGLGEHQGQAAGAAPTAAPAGLSSIPAPIPVPVPVPVPVQRYTPFPVPVPMPIPAAVTGLEAAQAAAPASAVAEGGGGGSGQEDSSELDELMALCLG